MSMVLVDKEKLKKALRDCVETGYIRGHCDTVENAFNLQYDMVSYEIVEALEHENGPVSSLNPIPADGLIEAVKKILPDLCAGCEVTVCGHCSILIMKEGLINALREIEEASNE